MKVKLLHFFRDESGQTLTEFILLAAVAVTIVAIMKTSLKKITVSVWTNLAKRIAAPCPNVAECDPGEGFDL